MTQVTGNIPQFEFRRIWLYSSKTTTVFNYCLLPHLLSEQSDAWIRSKAPGRNRGHVSQHNRWLQVLYFEGVTLATTLTVSHNGLHFMSSSQEAHWSAEKRTQCSATETPQWWISLDSGKRDYSQKQTKLNRYADLIQLMRGRESWFLLMPAQRGLSLICPP